MNRYLIQINNIKSERLKTIRNCLNGCLIETIDKIKSSFETCFSSNLSKFSDESSNQIEKFTSKTEILKSKEIFDSLVTYLPVNRKSSLVENQHKQLGKVIKKLGCEEITAESSFDQQKNRAGERMF